MSLLFFLMYAFWHHEKVHICYKFFYMFGLAVSVFKRSTAATIALATTAATATAVVVVATVYG